MFLFVIYNVKRCDKNTFSKRNNFNEIVPCDINHEKNRGMLLI